MKATVYIKLEIECEDSDDAFEVVDALLDDGTLQEEVILHAADDYAPMHVTSAISGGPGDMLIDLNRQQS